MELCLYDVREEIGTRKFFKELGYVVHTSMGTDMITIDTRLGYSIRMHVHEEDLEELEYWVDGLRKRVSVLHEREEKRQERKAQKKAERDAR